MPYGVYYTVEARPHSVPQLDRLDGRQRPQASDSAVKVRSLGVARAEKSATLKDMPTTRPRHFVTESDDLAAALDAAARRWPGLTRPQLLVRLALEGDHAAQQAHEERRRRRLAAVRHYSGILTGAYGPDYLRQLREEWPA